LASAPGTLPAPGTSPAGPSVFFYIEEPCGVPDMYNRWFYKRNTIPATVDRVIVFIANTDTGICDPETSLLPGKASQSSKLT
jgi:hypothetical protein